MADKIMVAPKKDGWAKEIVPCVQRRGRRNMKVVFLDRGQPGGLAHPPRYKAAIQTGLFPAIAAMAWGYSAENIIKWSKRKSILANEALRRDGAEIESSGRFNRFLSSQIQELIVSGPAEDLLKTRRREITVVFLDLRGFTAFAEIAEPEEVMRVVREYHAEMGRLVVQHKGTVERFAGDGMMIIFNDPLPVSDPAERAIRMALAMRSKLQDLTTKWRKFGYELDFGLGIDQGYATIGAIGFEGRWEYGAIGTVTNLASRLCGAAKPGQILVSQRLFAGIEELVEAEPAGELPLKGFRRHIAAHNILRLSQS